MRRDGLMYTKTTQRTRSALHNDRLKAVVYMPGNHSRSELVTPSLGR